MRQWLLMARTSRTAGRRIRASLCWLLVVLASTFPRWDQGVISIARGGDGASVLFSFWFFVFGFGGGSGWFLFIFSLFLLFVFSPKL